MNDANIVSAIAYSGRISHGLLGKPRLALSILSALLSASHDAVCGGDTVRHLELVGVALLSTPTCRIPRDNLLLAHKSRSVCHGMDLRSSWNRRGRRRSKSGSFLNPRETSNGLPFEFLTSRLFRSTLELFIPLNRENPTSPKA